MSVRDNSARVIVMPTAVPLFRFLLGTGMQKPARGRIADMVEEQTLSLWVLPF